jgi:hypothetical protein
MSSKDLCRRNPDHTSWSVSSATFPSARLRRGAFRSVDALIQAVTDFVEHHNDIPSPSSGQPQRPCDDSYEVKTDR